VTLMVEDEVNCENLRVLNRANTDRPNPSYPKATLQVWTAMVEMRFVYVPEFESAGKDYRCIFALPIIIEERVGRTSIGVVSIDSGRPHDFDGLEEKLELKLLPYISLLKLLLSLRGLYGGNNANNHRA